MKNKKYFIKVGDNLPLEFEVFNNRLWVNNEVEKMFYEVNSGYLSSASDVKKAIKAFLKIKDNNYQFLGA